MTENSTPESEPAPVKSPRLIRNYVSFVGAAIAIAAVVSIVLLFLVEITSKQENPYLGILTYIIFPGFLFLGLFVVLVGIILESRRRRRGGPTDLSAYPRLDLNDGRARRAFFVFLGITFVFVFASAFGSYKAYEYTESVSFCGETCHSVMKPEHVAHQAGAHARVACVECHVGSGPGWYLKYKLNGAYQLYSVTFNKYSRPIKTPVHNLRPATDTCEHCHWSEKFYGNQLKVFNRYAYDEKNSLRQTRMLINVGGGSSKTGVVAGIHWHMNVANKIDFISTDQKRQQIPWVRVEDQKGNVVEYFDRNRPPSAEQIATASKRRMDCVDCHNRPAHDYLAPDVAVDQSFASGRLDPALPFLKREAIAALTKSYNTEEEALRAIPASLDKFYSQNYPTVYSSNANAIKVAGTELQRVFRTYFFPEMKTNWEANPNNIGHLYSAGCFRCHDGEHVSKDGKVIRNDCSICHTVIYDSANPAASVKLGSYQHPVDLGGLANRKCESCHKADKPFQHPVNLGDISMFQCVECHPKQ